VSCKTQGSTDAKELTFDFADRDVRRNLALAFVFALEPPEFPASDVATAAAPCSRGTIALPSGTLELFGEDTDSPPRWATASGAPRTIIFVALMPRPEAARKWVNGGSQSQNGSVNFRPEDSMYVVALASDDEKRLIFHFFDGIPDDARLKAMMQTIAAGNGRWLVGFNVNSREVIANAP
jgi:hypothetical protein